MLVIVFWSLVAIVLLLMAFVRLAPISTEMLSSKPGPMEIGSHEKRGGAKLVLSIAELPSDAEAKLLAMALKEPRTKIVSSDNGHTVLITRSAVWGFPDVIKVWADRGKLHIHSHLVYGAYDLGVNLARLTRWRVALGQG